jgi:hypothetical protein
MAQNLRLIEAGTPGRGTAVRGGPLEIRDPPSQLKWADDGEGTETPTDASRRLRCRLQPVRFFRAILLERSSSPNGVDFRRR